MKEELIESILACVHLASWDDPVKLKEAAERVQKVFHLDPEAFEHVSARCNRYQTYLLQLTPMLSSTNESLALYIYDDYACRQQTLNNNEFYSIELGSSQNYMIRFNLAKFNGETRKAVIRSRSLLRRIISIDRKDREHVDLSQIPLGSTIRKHISMRGKVHEIEIKLVRKEHRELIEAMNFEQIAELSRILHEYQSENSKGNEYDGVLDDVSYRILRSVIVILNLPAAILSLSELVNFLVWDTEKKDLDEVAIIRTYRELKSSQIDTLPIVEDALNRLSDCLKDYLIETLKQHAPQRFFPPAPRVVLKKLNILLKPTSDICVLQMWENVVEGKDPSVFLTTKISEILVDSVHRWIEEDIKKTDFKDLWSLLQVTWAELSTDFHPSCLFFHQFGVDYLKTVFETIDSPLVEYVQNYITNELSKLDSRNDEVLETFTKRTMKMFDLLRCIVEFAEAHHVDSLVCSEYESWFAQVTIFWTYSWRKITRSLVERTISLDDDGDECKYEQRRPLPAGLYSFLCVQKGLSDDYCRLRFKNPQNVLMGSVAVTNIFCENICCYSKKLFNDAVTSVVDQSSRLARAMNGIEQAMSFVEERWGRFSAVERMSEVLSPEEITSILRTMTNVLESTRSRCDNLIEALCHKYCSIQSEEVTAIVKSMTLDHSEYRRSLSSYMRDLSQHERTNSILISTEKVIQDVSSALLPNCYKYGRVQLAKLFEREVERLLRERQPPEYYTNVYFTLKLIYELLDIVPGNSQLLTSLHQKSFSTMELLLAYYAMLCEKIEESKIPDAPIISLNIGHYKSSPDTIILIIDIKHLSTINWIDPLCDRLDTFVKLELLPVALSATKPLTTKPVPQSTQPQWNQRFKMAVSTQNFYTHGVTLGITVMDHDRLCDRVIGKCFIALNKIEETKNPNGVDLPQSLNLSLLPHPSNHDSVFFQLLKHRSRFEPVSRAFIAREGKLQYRLPSLPRSIHRRIKSNP